MVGPPAVNEATTRSQLIDVDLARAGWSASKRTAITEYVLQVAEDETSYGARGFADYVLLGSDGKPLAVVEAKSTTCDVLAGKQQASHYADAIRSKFGCDPFIFLANGKEILFWDRERYPPRKVAGFYTRDDLERLRHQRQYAKRLHEVDVNPDIAGRDYQNEAIRRVNGLRPATVRSEVLGGECRRADQSGKHRGLLNLSARWTREFKAEHAKQQGALR